MGSVSEMSPRIIACRKISRAPGALTQRLTCDQSPTEEFTCAVSPSGLALMAAPISFGRKRPVPTYLFFNILAICAVDREAPSDSSAGLRSRLSVVRAFRPLGCKCC